MAKHYKISAALVTEESSYVLQVDGYSRAKELMKTGEFLDFGPFTVGGHSWTVRCYPNVKDWARCISFYLHLDPAGAKDVKAKFTVSVLDKTGEPVPSVSSGIRMHTFSGGAPDPGYAIDKAVLEGSEHLRDDCLTMRCVVTVTKEIHGEEQFVVVPPRDLHQQLGNLLKNKDAADITFQVGEQRFPAHRCLLAARSSVFKAELLGAMKESGHSLIEIRDMEADVFESLLYFIYTDSIPINKGVSRGDLLMAGHLLVAAGRYNIQRLKLICEENLCNHVDSDMVATSLALAEQHGFHALKEACLKFLASPSNLEAMMAIDGFEHLKSSCPSVLKELVAITMPAELKATKDLIMAIW